MPKKLLKMAKFQIVEIEEMRRFMLSCFTSAKIKESHASDLVDVLLQADIKNHLSHGLNRMEMYLKDFRLKGILFIA